MAKRLLLNVLTKVLGEFIELDENNLSLAVWSGQVILTNLKLKEINFLKKYNFMINHGSVSTLEIVIPWASLLNSPLKIKMEGVYVDISSLDERTVDVNEVLQGLLDEKLKQLQLLDQYLELSQSVMGNEGKQPESYLQQWTSKIIDNIELSLSHVHIRYEDNQTVPDETFAAGITLESFVITTCDDNWQPAFVSRGTGESNYVNKLATMQNLGIYWDIDCESSASLQFNEWKNYMHSMIQIRGTEVPFKINYILAPNGSSMFMKLIHYKNPSERSPHFHVIAESNDLQLSLDKLQYQQIFQLYYRLSCRKQIVDPRCYRPAERPVNRLLAKAWWKYALKMVRCKPRYIKLIRLKKRAELEEVEARVLMSDEELAELTEMEICFPLEVLKRFRQAAIMEILSEDRKERFREMRKEAVSWWSWLSTKDSGNDISIENIIEELDKQESVSTNQLFSAFKISISASSNLTLSSRLAPIIDFRTAVAISVEKNRKAFVVSCNLTDLLIKDIMGVTPFHPQIVAVKRDHINNKYPKDISRSHKPTVSITVTNTEEKIEVTASALPIEIFINKIIIQTLLAEFSTPKNRFERRVENPKLKTLRETVSALMVPQHPKSNAKDVQKSTTSNKKPIEITLDAHAPKIIIPEDCTQDIGYLLLDCGYLAMKGFITDAGMSFSVSLTSINAGLPFHVQDLYSLADLSLYLIKPFDFELSLQNMDKSDAEMTANVSIKPELRGCIDAVKLARLLRIVYGLPDTFSAKSSSELTAASLQSSKSNLQMVNNNQFTPCKSESENYGSEGFHTPIRITLTPTKNSITPNWSSSESNKVAAMSSAYESPSVNPIPPNPYKVGMKIKVNLPVLALDLSYVVNGVPQQLLFAIERLHLDIMNRCYDRQIIFDMSALSIQDSARVLEQRYVVWTPKEGGDLVHIVYTSMNNKLSPLYREHGQEIRARFAQLSLAVDIITLSHLKPFFEVLLDKNNRNPPPLPVQMVTQPSVANLNSSNLEQGKTTIVESLENPPGMKVYATLGKLSMDLLRPPTNLNQVGEYLEPAFSMHINIMLLNIDMIDLMKATVNLRSFIIEDSRSASKDYAFRNLFIPLKLEESGSDAEEEPEDLLVVTYNQESKYHSFISVAVSGVTSFVAVDTILDFAMIFMANFFALTGLLSSPNSEPPPPPPPLPFISSGDSQMPTTIPAELIIARSTMNVTVQMVNSRLILLEDPALHESRALVGQCALQVHYTKDTKTAKSCVELFESVHVTVSKNEVFVLSSMAQWNPTSILQPFDVELHLKRNRINEDTVFSSLQVELENIDARVSFNDLLLAQTIFSRRFLADSANTSATSNNNSSSSNANVNSTQSTIPSNISITPSIMISFGLNSLSVVVINDFNAAAIPVLKMSIEESNFFAEGPIGNTHGEGSATIKFDYFNSPIMVWEPLLETWKPVFKIYKESFSNILEIRSDHTLQLTVSGSMLVSLLRSYTLFFHEFERERKDASAITIHNALGDNIDIDILDSSNKVKFLEILDGEIKQLSAANTIAVSQSQSKENSIPTTINIVVKGPLTDERLPVLHLPFNANKPRACILQPANIPDKKQLLMEPIEEEAFENSRYDPITGKWRPPYLLGDPFQWTDASGVNKRDPSTLQIQSGKWDWAGRWEVDMDGLVGVEIDKDGWEFSASFSAFSIVSPRRTFQSMDCVRRRRWVRTRIPRITVENYKMIPLILFWDVKSISNGSRRVEIRSGYQIINDLGCDIKISLFHTSWDSDYVLTVTRNGGSGNVPLLKSFATQIKFQPISDDSEACYEWSNYFSSNSNSYDCKISRDVVCEAEAGRFIFFRMWTIRTNKSLTIKLVPYITISNSLLCHVHYRCSCLNQDAESKMIPSGEIHKLKYTNMVEEPNISFQLGTYDWSTDFPLFNNNNHYLENVEHEKVILMRKGNGDVLPISVKTKLSSDFTLEVSVYFKVAMIDRSGLNLLIRGNLTTQGDSELIRGFNTQDDQLLFFQKRHVSISNQPMTSTGSGHFQPAILSSLSMSVDEYKDSSGKSVSNRISTAAAAADFKKMSNNLIDNVLCNSMHSIGMIKADIGSTVYTDAKFKWSYLPTTLRNRKMFKLPLQDKNSRTNSYLQFDVLEASIVIIFVDVQAQLKWMQIEGYQKTSELGIARHLVKNQKMQEYHFAIYGKLFAARSTVTLRGNWDKNISSMYCVMIIPENDLIQFDNQFLDVQKSSYQKHSLYQQIIFPYNFTLELAGLCWIEGCENISAFYTADQNIAIRTSSEESWSEEINIDTRKNSSNKSSFDIHCPRSGIIYQLSYTLQNLPGLYHETQLVTFMPRYAILNCMDESVFISQKGSNKHMEFFPYQPEGWHIIDDHFGTDIKLRTQSSIWSLGAININEIGSSVLYIPYSSATSSSTANPTSAATTLPSEKDRGIVLHIEVKLAEKHDNCSIIVVIWQETIESSALMSIQNDSDVPITIRQAEIELDHDLGDKESLYEFTVLPGKHVPYGWCDPDCGTHVMVGVGYSLKNLHKRIATLNMLKDGQRLRLPYTHSTTGNQVNEVILTISTSDAGRILYVAKSNPAVRSLLMDEEGDPSTVLTPTPTTNQFTTVSIFGINLILSSVGISLVLENPCRREFMSMYMDGLELLLRFKGTMRTIEFTIMDLQLDNYSETSLYPVLLRSKKKEIRKSVLYNVEETAILGNGKQLSNKDRSLMMLKTSAKRSMKINAAGEQEEEEEQEFYGLENEQEQPFIQLSIVQDQAVVSASITPRSIFRYVALRILSFRVEIDSASLQILFMDLLDDLKILTSSQILAIGYPQHWLQSFNEEQLFPSMKLINVFHTKLTAQQSKVYIKNLIIHPMKVTVTFTQTTVPRKFHKETLQSTMLNIFMSLVGIEKLQIKLNSFEVEDAMESYETLLSLITTKSIQDVRSQLAMIAGSLAMIGSPVGFARKVGSGVKAFFYEPYLGAVHGSHDFFTGLKKGTSRLITGVVIGAMDSAVAFVGTASKGMSYLSGDSEFVRKRAIKRQQSSLIHGGGVYAGFRDGGESIVSGFASGVSGLISKPFEEAAKGGIQGFFKGIGLGVLGAAVKPLVGLTEGLTSIAHGIANQVDPNSRSYHVRPPRALERSIADAHTLVIVALNLDAAFAQDFVMKRAHQHNYEDSFLGYVSLDIHQETVILSEVYLYWRRANVLWGRVWANISHCVYMGDAVGIMLYSGAVNGRAELATIRCGSRNAVKRLYIALALNAHRMGNPSKVHPPDLIDWMNSEDWFQSNIQATDQENATLQELFYRKLLSEASMLGELDGYRFGSVNGKILPQVSGTEHDILTRAQYFLQQHQTQWKSLDEHIWKMLWEWGCIHAHLASCRCCVTVFINRSESPIQITRLHMLMGRNILIIGSEGTGYEYESRLILPHGYVIIFISAFPQSPLEIGHLKANIHSAAFSAVLASTQRETTCDAKGGFKIGFLEKTVSEWWSKYIVVVS